MVDAKALQTLERIIDSGPRPFDIFEYGSSGSTVWYGKKNVGQVISVEHTQEWHDRVTANCAGLPVQVILRVPASESGLLHSKMMPDMNFSSYINILPELNRKFDLIMVDGRARVLCFKEAIKHVKQGGYLLLHDAERSWYNPRFRIAPRHGFVIREIIEARSTLVCKFGSEG